MPFVYFCISYFVLYVMSFVIIYGWSLAYFQVKYPGIERITYKRDLEVSATVAALLSLVLILGVAQAYAMTDKARYGFLLK